VAVRLFVGNMPYGATEADLRTHFSAVGAPSHIAIPVDRETGRPRGFAFVEFLDRAVAEEAVQRFDQQPFMGRSLSVSEARPREERPAGGFRPSGPGVLHGPVVPAADSAPAPQAAPRQPAARTSGHPRRRAPATRSDGKPKTAARRARSKSASRGVWAASTTTRPTSRCRPKRWRTSTTSRRAREKTTSRPLGAVRRGAT
jgi:RNA recognition motif-containing protein